MTDQTGAASAYGGFWIRFLAYIVDSLIVFIGCVVIAAAAALAGEIASAIGSLVLLVGPFLYFAGMQASARQATFGKALLGLKVAGAGGDRISFLRSLGRELAKLISAFALMIGFLLAAFTQRKQALHDMVASTVVVRDSPGHVLAALALALAAIAAPFVLVTFLGLGMMAAMLGPMAGAVMEAQPPARPPAAQVAKPRPGKPAPAPQAKAPAKPPAPAKPAAPAVAVAKELPKPVELPKPAPVAKAPPPPPPPKLASAPVPVAPPVRAAPATPFRPGPSVPGPKFNDLMTAVMYRDAAGVQELLAFGKWPDKPDSRGFTPLAVAVMLGDAASAEVLLKAGANPDGARRVALELDDAAMRALLERYRRK